jgi:hypothetical protein
MIIKGEPKVWGKVNSRLLRRKEIRFHKAHFRPVILIDFSGCKNYI